jgi:hypothetical protein
MTIQKSLANLTEQDLRALVAGAVAESETLDYKLQMYGTSENDRKELLRDVSSMANNRGGYLLIGIREEQEVAQEIVGIQDAEASAQRILSSALTGIQDRINGLDAKPVPLANGAAVLAIYIPPSTRAPHMVTYANEDRFWIRHGRQKMRMSLEEVRQACSKVQNIYERAEQFLHSRQSLAIKNWAITIGQQCVLHIAATPLTLGIDRFDTSRQDVRELLEDPPGMRASGWTVRFPRHALVQPSMFGLRREIRESRYFEVFRNGHTEFRVLLEIDGHHFTTGTFNGQEARILKPLALVEYTVSTFRLYKAVADVVGILDSVIASFHMYYAGGWAIGRSPNRDEWVTGPWPEQDFNLPPMELPASMAADAMAKAVLDRVWQSFGGEVAPYFRNGVFTPPPQ